MTKNTAPIARRADRIRPTGESVAWVAMAAVTVYHNPRCSKSRQALEAAEDLGASVDVVRYLDDPPDGATLRAIIAKLEDPVTDLVRQECWDELGVSADDVATADGVVDVLVRHPQLLQRPLLVSADRAVIGRPTERARELLSG